VADNVTLNSMTGGPVVAADEVTDGTLGTVKVQYVKLMDGTLDGTSKAVISSAGLQVIERGTTIASGNASVTTSAATVLAADATRRTAVLTNLGSDYVWIGDSGITANEGIRLAPGQTLTVDKAPTPAIYAVAQSGTQTVAYFTEAD
jgi:hypothetical protein